MADRSLVIVMRGEAWGLPTACPACLPSFIYLTLARIPFSVQYTNFRPDSDDLPILEYGDLVGFGSETGGIFEILRREKITDLDSVLSELDKSELHAYTALVNSWLADALLYELWSKENDATVSEVYLSAIPWPANKAIDWKQRRSVMNRLGITAENTSERTAELYRKAAVAYEALAVRLQDQNYFFSSRPTSLDALVLGHILFVQHAPLEVSVLKTELLKYPNLVSYADTMRDKVIRETGSTFVPRGRSAASKTSSSSSVNTGNTSSGAAAKEMNPKNRTQKEKFFRKRAKYFIIMQVAAVILYVVFAGIEVEEDTMDDDGGVDD